MKYYVKKGGIIRNEVKAYKVYDKMPEDMPEPFKSSKLICFDEVYVTHTIAGKSIIEVHHHSMTDGEGIEKHIKGFDETDEVTFERLMKLAENINEMTKIITK